MLHRLVRNPPVVQVGPGVEMSLFDENTKILAGFERGGSDLSFSRSVDFSHLFPDRASADAFAAWAASEGCQIDITENDDGDEPWDVTVTAIMQPSAANITGWEERLGDRAQAHGGRSDGWGFFRT